jgi:hypothetical protein
VRLALAEVLRRQLGDLARRPDPGVLGDVPAQRAVRVDLDLPGLV